MKKALSFLFAFIFIINIAKSQAPSIIMKTSKSIGSSFTFQLGVNAKNTIVQIDFGDGVKVNKTIDNYTTITGTLTGSQTIKIYGPGITSLTCNSIQLTSLDVSNNNTLQTLFCHENELTALDVTQNTVLATLWCFLNQITNLDVTKNTKLTKLDCAYNNLTVLDISQNLYLTELTCNNNQLTALNVNNNASLTYLSCYLNQLNALDVTKNLFLTNLGCSYNQLTSLDVAKNTKLTSISCYDNQISSLNVSNCINLSSLFCSNNLFSILDVSKNIELTELWCQENKLTALDVSKNVSLQSLRCHTNKLSTLNISNNTELKILFCYLNQLTELDVTKNNALTHLYCAGNQISLLDVSKNTALKELLCGINKLSFATLPLPKQEWTKYLYSSQAPINMEEKSIQTGTEIDLSSQNLFNGIYTIYTWKTKAGISLIENTDYTINSGKTTFIRPQQDSVYCEMKNAVFPDFTGTGVLKTICLSIQSSQLQTITFSAISEKTANDAPFDLSATASSGLPVTFISSDPTIASIDGTTVTIHKAGTVTFSAVQGGDVTWASAKATQLLVIAKQTQTVIFNPLPDKFAGEAPFELTASSSSTLPVIFTSSDPSVASINGTTVTTHKSGTITITATQAGNEVWSVASATQSFIVRKMNQTIVFDIMPSKKYGDKPFTLLASSSSGLSIDYSSSNTSVASITGNIVTISGAGTSNITALQGGDNRYNPAISVTNILTVEKADLTIKADNKIRFQGKSNPVFTLTYSGLVKNSDLESLTSPDIHCKADTTSLPGNYNIVLTGGTSSNYNLVLKDGILTIIDVNQRKYVKYNATGKNDGSSWTDAFNYLSDALHSITSGEIWVAEGIYSPGGSNPTRDSTFRMKNNVRIYGGFNGIETEFEQRNYSLYKTVLSGNVGDKNNITDNIKHIIKNSYIDSTAVLDGFTIQDNYDETNVLFGGAIFNYSASPQIYNCIITNNYSVSCGGIFNYLSNARIVNCNIYNNISSGSGGITCQNKSNAKFINCNIVNNISENYTSGAGGVFVDHSSPSFSNCIIWGNYGSLAKDCIVFSESWPMFQNCILNDSAAFFAEISEAKSKKKDNINSDPLFILGPNNSLSLDPGSPAINSGTLDTSGFLLPSKDLMGNDRIYNRIDIGAVEYMDLKQPQIIIFDDIPTKTYGDQPFSLNASANFGLVSFISSNNKIATIKDNMVTIVGAGKTIITVTHVDNNEVSKVQLLNVNKAQLKAYADSKQRIYGHANPNLTISYSGFVNGDTKTAIMEPTISCNATTLSDTGAYTISLNEGSADNYNISLYNGLLYIKKAALIVVANDASRNINENNPQFSLRISGFLNNENTKDIDKLPLTDCEADSSSAPGIYPISVSGGEDNHYTFYYISGKLAVNNITGTNDLTNRKIKIFPVPANDFIYLESLDNASNKIEIFNSNGIKIIEKTINDNKVDISSLSKGLYFLKIKGASYKFIKT